MLANTTVRASLRCVLLGTVATMIVFGGAQAATPIDTAQPFYLQSNVGTTVNPDFQGGTLRDNVNGATDTHAYNVENFPSNTIDAFGNTTTFTGIFSGAGPLTIADSVGGGVVVLTNVESYSGTTTIDTGATLQLGNGSGTVGLLAGAITDNGSLVFDGGGGSLALYATGVTGTGRMVLTSGTLELEGDNTYSGSTTIASGATLDIVGTGSIANSSTVADAGTFDISGASSGVSITSLSGAGSVALGNNTLTISNGNIADVFSGGIGGNGGLTIAGGTATLTGFNTFTGTTTVDTGAELQLGNGGALGIIGRLQAIEETGVDHRADAVEGLDATGAGTKDADGNWDATTLRLAAPRAPAAAKAPASGQ